MNKEENMVKLREIDELLSFIPAKSIDEFANLSNKKKKNNKINTNNNLLSLNEISNKLSEKINNFQTNKGKKRQRNNPKFKKGDTPRSKLNGGDNKGDNKTDKKVNSNSNSKNKNIKMETD
jgi:hypothetical protein